MCQETFRRRKPFYLDLVLFVECVFVSVCIPTEDRGNENPSQATIQNRPSQPTTKDANMGRSRYQITEPQAPHFLTLTVSHWIPLFTRPAGVDILLGSFQYLMQEGFTLYAYVILENHIHLIAQSPQLDVHVRRFKSYTSRQLIGYLQEKKASLLLDQLAFYKKRHKRDRLYQIWQEGSHPILIQNKEMMRQKIEYIHRNPVERGYVDDPVHWRYSSARDYAGSPGLLTVERVW